MFTVIPPTIQREIFVHLLVQTIVCGVITTVGSFLVKCDEITIFL